MLTKDPYTRATDPRCIHNMAEWPQTVGYVARAVAIGWRRDRFEPTPAVQPMANAVLYAINCGASDDWFTSRRDV